MIPLRFYWLFDFVTILFAFLGAYFLLPVTHLLLIQKGVLPRQWINFLGTSHVENITLPYLTDWLHVFFIMAPIIILVLGIMGNHRPIFHQSRTRILLGGIIAPFVAISPLTWISYALKNPNISRLFIFSFMGLSSLGLLAYRFALRRHFLPRQLSGKYAKNVVLIGAPDSIDWLARYFRENIPKSAYRLFGYLEVSPRQTGPPPVPGTHNSEEEAPLITRLGRVQELGDLLINKPIQEVVAVLPSGNGHWIEGVIRDCDQMGVSLRVVPEILLFQGQRNLQTLYFREELHLPAVMLNASHPNSEALFFKRLLDVAVSGLLLLVLSPVLALIALAIKITTPQLSVFYPWRVVGQNGVEFTGYKFTTMTADADQRKSELDSRNEMNGPVFKIKDDPRVTPLGRFLRKYSLNELPQLWSVWKGDMSLVGPRPAFRHELDRYNFWQKRKLSIKPGITCLWQIRGRNKINDFDDWVRMDLEYIDHWSLWLDFKILFWTAWVVVRGTGC